MRLKPTGKEGADIIRATEVETSASVTYQEGFPNDPSTRRRFARGPHARRSGHRPGRRPGPGHRLRSGEEGSDPQDPQGQEGEEGSRPGPIIGSDGYLLFEKAEAVPIASAF